MALVQVNGNNMQELILERNNCLPPLLSSLDDINHFIKLLENIKLCTKYLSTYNVSNVDEELLQHIIPVIKERLLKLYDDNFLLSETVEGEFVLKILKENLQVAVGFIQVIKVILEFVSAHSEVYLYYLKNTSTNLAQLILSTFEHCKNSTEGYKNAFNIELLELFRVTQEVHLLFLKLFEMYIVIKNEVDNTEEIQILTQVLDIICGMSKTLSELNIKSMSDNWKGYTTVAQKFSSMLVDTIDLKLPISCLSYQVDRNLSSIVNQGQMDAKLVSQMVKITSFLIKVALKISDVFWNCLERALSELLKLCCTVYSFPLNLYQIKGYLPEILDLVDTAIFKTVEPLLPRLLNDPVSLKLLSRDCLCSEKCHFGLINFLKNLLKVLVTSQINISQHILVEVVDAIFNNVRLCFTEFFWNNEPMGSIFDSLVLNISAALILYDGCYAEVELILLKNLLQEHIFAALLAMEVWTLFLRNSTPQFCLLTLTNLIQKYQETNFGLLTSRPERIYLKCFIQRIFSMLPNYTKNDFVLRHNPVRNMEYWKVIEFGKFPVQQRLSIEGVCVVTIDKIEAMGRSGCNFDDITFIGENLAALSTVNFNETGLNPANFAAAVYNLWQFNLDTSDVADNNIFKYFLTQLCKVTGSLASEFSSKQLATVLSKLKILSVNNSYKVITCVFLSVLSNKHLENGQDNAKIYALITEIISYNLLIANSNVIKQEALEVIDNFAIKGKHDVAKNISLSKEMQNEIANYLQRNAVPVKFDKEYYELLGKISYRHECVKWKTESSIPKTKKLKYDDISLNTEANCRKEQLTVEKHTKPSKWCKNVEPAPKVNDPDENKPEGSAGDVIGNIRGEVKCLVNVLKTEKLTAKNASDIRLIANQLLSFL